VQASPAYMSMMHGRDTMMIELIQLTRTEGGYELLAAYEEALYELGGRPHWGQVNTLTGSHGLVDSMYPRYRDWLEVRGRLDSDGVFDSAFTKRVGISEERFSSG
jgi:D-arabinono-1,4-lactone oxidase